MELHILYHSHTTYVIIDNQELSVCDSIGGLWIQQLYGWTSVRSFKMQKKNWRNLQIYWNRHSGVGIVICVGPNVLLMMNVWKSIIKCRF
jgi:hypothetical protein